MPRKLDKLNLLDKIEEPLKMHFEEGLDYEQIGVRLGKPKDYIYCLFKLFKEKLEINHTLTKYDYYFYIGEMENIIKKYNGGISTIELAKEYGVSDRTIISWLRKSNIEIRNPGPISRVEQKLFEVIDSEIKAYTLGLLMSDGNVSKKGNTISITLTQNDKYVLEQINDELLGGMGNIVITHKDSSKPRAVLQFNGKKLKEDLKQYNIIPAKSHTLQSLPNNIPTNLYHHFIRGLYDGDGVCSYYTSSKKRKVRIGYCGASKEFVKSYQNFLVETIGLNRTKLFNTGNCWQCSWGSRQNLEDFYNYIYKDATIYLGRKYKKLKDFLNNN